ncbi:Divalent-cation tolerance protein CutA [Xanthomonas fragariae]|uniref:Divalent-cation tolerance protein CutA n=2 Tax=Xanthomonas fragariae TaxID=48664 RepID=A0ABY1RK60_9XANT|nr:divalent cation tolerance protein [Xanthomonas fragariae]SMQ97661.1 Divalent-cation tolerance protein CutA [Xanthomonas fragariae]
MFRNRWSIPSRQGITLIGPMNASPLHLLFSTCPDADSADHIAHALLDERLAACVTQLPGAQSLYRWNGAIERSQEVQLLIKTCEDRLHDAIARLQALHPYELPEAVAVQASAGLSAYLDWVRAETRKES